MLSPCVPLKHWRIPNTLQERQSKDHAPVFIGILTWLAKLSGNPAQWSCVRYYYLKAITSKETI
jgi:hypothetical protein